MKYFFFFTRLLIQIRLKFWHRPPLQMLIRCYLIEGQSRTNKSNRKQLTLSAHGNTCFAHFEKMKTTFGTHNHTSYISHLLQNKHAQNLIPAYADMGHHYQFLEIKKMIAIIITLRAFCMITKLILLIVLSMSPHITNKATFIMSSVKLRR